MHSSVMLRSIVKLVYKYKSYYYLQYIQEILKAKSKKEMNIVTLVVICRKRMTLDFKSYWYAFVLLRNNSKPRNNNFQMSK